MKIYETAVRKPVSTILIFVGVIVFGLFSLSNLAVDQYPDIEIPQISVITTYAGANAADIETNVTRVLEDNLNTVENLKKMTSKSSDNFSMITLEFEYGSDLTEAANDIRDAVSRTQSLLPDEVDYPTIFKFSSSMMPVMMLAITADESYPALDKILDDKLVNVLNRVDGVGAVSVTGAPEREVQVNVDPRKIEAYGLSIEQIGSIVAAENVNVPSGTIDIGNNTYNLKADGEFTDAGMQLGKVVLANAGGRKVLLSDVAEIRDTLEKATMDERVNGQRGVRVIIQKQSGANTVDIVHEIQKRLPAIEESLPSDVDIELIFEGSQEITDAINSLSETILYAFIFVVLVVMVFLGRWRATFIICLTIPVSLICSFIYLYAVGSTLNIISLSSLSIAIGMVVDDAIVVLENITTHIERGSKPKEAAIYATNEVWLSVIATTLVTVAVFLPLTMISGFAGIMFRELGWIVSIVVSVSTAAAISLTPMLSAYILHKEGGIHDYKGIGIVYKPIDRALAWLDNAYARALRGVLAHRRWTLGTVGALFVASLFLLTQVPTEFFPPSDNGRIEAVVKLPQNVSVEYTARVARRIDSILYEKYPEVILVSASAGASSADNAFSAMQTTGSHIINYNLRLPRSSERERSIYVISDLLRKDLDRIPEIEEYTVSPGGTGSMGGSSNVKIKVYGYDMNVTNDVANDLKDRIARIPGIRDANLSRDDLRPEYNVVFDRDRLAYYGLTSATASQAVRNRINGLDASKYREDGDEYDIVVRYGEPYRTRLEDVEEIVLYGSDGRPVKLKEVGEVREEFAAPSIERENRQRVIYVEASLGAGVALGEVVTAINGLLRDYAVPAGVDLELGGTVEDQGDAFGDLLTLLALIVILVYIVMATQFESLVYPFLIMFTIPLAFTGVFLALWGTGTPLSLIALIGAIMLVGIVTKNGIVLVDYTNLLVERGASLFDAVVAGGKSRLRPVLMTSFTTILGMLPLALGTGEGSETWQPMGIAVIGGLTFSTLLTLLVVPVLYSVFVNRRIRKTLPGQAEPLV